MDDSVVFDLESLCKLLRATSHEDSVVVEKAIRFLYEVFVAVPPNCIVKAGVISCKKLDKSEVSVSSFPREAVISKLTDGSEDVIIDYDSIIYPSLTEASEVRLPV